MPFSFKKLKIPDVLLIKPNAVKDNRGFFMETWKDSEFRKAGIPSFVQENHSFSVKNVLRGLHYQTAPKGQGKLVRCIRGEIFDIAVDIRENSPTRYSWVSAVLSEKNHHEFYIPEGFAHGFCVMSNTTEVVYKCTSEYSPENEQGILWNDPVIGILWPISSPILSEKDKQYKSL
ncbi:dTDP-4-dehydrorhamnose 3,5-epimerase [Patescibacteria group bacterium]|nr:dTDP-4-dehydrorhamnose 3,5-epimerase [Patescibacteria group bacterium]